MRLPAAQKADQRQRGSGESMGLGSGLASGSGLTSGSALVSALVLVAIAAAIASVIAWQGLVQISRAELSRDQAQAQWIARAAVRYAQWLLQVDGGLTGANTATDSSSLIDHLSEPWAQRIPITPIQDLFPTQISKEDALQFGQARFAGGIEDLHARLNLADLLASSDPSAQALAQWQAITSMAGLANEEGNNLLAQLQQAGSQMRESRHRPALAQRLAALQSALTRAKLKPAAHARLEQWLTWLPETTPVNVNTAPLEVIAAALGQAQGVGIDRLIETRERFPLRTISEVEAVLGNRYYVSNRLDTKSRFFQAKGVAIFGRAELPFEAFIRRNGEVSSVLLYREGAL